MSLQGEGSMPRAWQAHVLGCERPQSLSRLLDSLAASHYSGARVDLHVHLGADCQGPAALATASVARQYSKRWHHGKSTVASSSFSISHEHGNHSIWRSAWSPSETDQRAVILPEDMELSPWWHQWLDAARNAYNDGDASRPLAGIALNQLEVVRDGKLAHLPPMKGPILSRTASSWGFAPSAAAWKAFLDSYSVMDAGRNFTSPSRMTPALYQRGGWIDSFAAFCDKRGLLTLYSFVRPNRFALATHRREHGDRQSNVEGSVAEPELLVATANESAHSPTALLALPPLSELSRAEDFALSDEDIKVDSMKLRSTASRRAAEVKHSVQDTYAQMLSNRFFNVSLGWDDIWKSEHLGLQALVQPTVGQLSLLTVSLSFIVLHIASEVVIRSRPSPGPLGLELIELRPTLRHMNEGSAILFMVYTAHFLIPKLPQTHEPFLFYGLLLLAFVTAVMWRRPIEESSAGSLGRELTLEWRGWMQIVFVCYHYFAMWEITHIVRCFVSAYVLMAAYGNSMYYGKTEDFSFGRFFQSLWRINFFSVLLSLVTSTPWIAYYACALHTTHFVLCFIANFFSGANAPYFRECMKYPAAADLKQRKTEMMAGAAVLVAVLSAIIWDVPGFYDRFPGLAISKLFGAYFNQHYKYRTYLDHFSSVPGILLALIMLSPPGYLATALEKNKKQTRWVLVVTAAVLAIVWRLVFFATTQRAQLSVSDPFRMVAYSSAHPYVSVFIWPAYLLLRGANRWLLTTVSVPLEYVGKRCLEFYLLQFHLFLANGSNGVHGLVTIVPGGKLPNFILCLCIYSICATRVFTLTHHLRDAAFSGRWEKRIAWCLAIFAGSALSAHCALGSMPWFNMWFFGGSALAMINYLPWFREWLENFLEYIGEDPAMRHTPTSEESGLLSRARAVRVAGEEPATSYGTSLSSGEGRTPQHAPAVAERATVQAPLCALLFMLFFGHLMLPVHMWLKDRCAAPTCTKLSQSPSHGWVAERFDVFADQWHCDASPWTSENTSHACLNSFGSARNADNPWLKAKQDLLSADAPFADDCRLSSSPESPGWSDVKPWMRYKACGRESLVEMAPMRLLYLIARLPRRRMVFYGDDTGRQFFKGTVSALVRVPGVSFELLPPTRVAKGGKLSGWVESTPGVRIYLSDDPTSSSSDVTIEYVKMELYESGMMASLVQELRPDLVLVNMGMNYQNADSFIAAVKGLRKDVDRFDVEPREGEFRTRFLMAEIQPYGVCEHATAKRHERCVCEHTESADRRVQGLNQLSYTWLEDKMIRNIFADYYGRMDAYLGPAGVDGGNCQQMRPLDGLFEPFIARTVEYWPVDQDVNSR